MGVTPGGKAEKFRTKSTPAAAAITNLTKDKDGSHAENVANAWNLALANDTPVIISEFGSRSDRNTLSGENWQTKALENVPILYVDAQPVDTSAFPMLAPLNLAVARRGTLAGVTWDVIDADIGVTVAIGGKDARIRAGRPQGSPGAQLRSNR